LKGSSRVTIGEVDLELKRFRDEIHISVSENFGSRIISSISSSSESFVVSMGRENCSTIGDKLNVGVDILSGGMETVPGLALSSDPGNSRSISLGD